MQIRCLSFMSLLEKEEFAVRVIDYAPTIRGGYLNRRPKPPTVASLDRAARRRKNVIYDVLCRLIDRGWISLRSREEGIPGSCASTVFC